MTVRAAAANGNLTSASTWEAVDATSYSNSESANTALTTSQVSSSTFTPGAIQIDGIGVKIASRAASPTGTITVQLTQGGVLVTGTNVTINVSDLPTCTATSGTTTPVSTAEGGWVFFKFAAPVTLAAATAYAVSAATSSATQVNLWSTATTNWSRFLRTTTTGAPVAGDDLIITGEWTAAATMTARAVTMDSTAATDYGSNTTTQVTPASSICKGGTLSFGIAASTSYVMQQSGYMVVYNGGTLNIGSLGSEVPRGSSATLQFDCVADGDFGLVARNGAAVNMYGLSRTLGNNTVITLLAADAAGGATSLTTAASTGWLSGDAVCYAPTSQTSTQYETKTLTAGASGTTLTTNALSNAHSGTSPTQAQVGLLTRNVVMKAVTANVVTFFYVGTTATINLSFAEFAYISTNATGKRGIEIATTTGSFSADSISIHDCDAGAWIYVATSGNGFSFTNSVFYNVQIATATSTTGVNSATSATWTISSCMFCGSSTAGSTLLLMQDVGGTFTNNSLSGSPNGAMSLNETGVIGTFSGNDIHSCGALGISTLTSHPSGVISSSNFWRISGASSSGFTFASSSAAAVTTMTFVSCNFFGNGRDGFNVSNAIVDIVMDNCTFNSDTTFTQTNGILLGAAIFNLTMYSCSFSVVSGVKTKNTNDLNFSSNTQPFVFADNCVLNGTNVYAGVTSANPSQAFNLPPFLACENFGQVANDNRQFWAQGAATASISQSNSTTVHGSDVLSQQLSPSSASVKFQSSPILVPLNSGQSKIVSVWVQKNGSYAGNAPRLILKRQDSMGITSDVVCATFSAAANTWQQLSYTTAAAPQAGVLSFCVDCDGTTGSVFVSDAAAG